MKIAIIGAGLIGVTSAWFLAAAGHEVMVIDRAEGPGRETSFANGALLTPSMADPWNAPGCWRTLLQSIVQNDSSLQLRLRELPDLAGWGLRFLWESRQSAFHRNTLANLHLALQSLTAMETVRRETDIDYGRRTGGTLRLFRDPAALERARCAALMFAREGVEHQVLAPTGIAAADPGLACIASELAGAIHYPLDEAGDAFRFCIGLAQAATERGVVFRYGTAIDRLEVEDRRIVAASCGERRFAADTFVVATASYARRLLRTAGLKLPVRPAKGYSITLDVPSGTRILGTPLVDDAFHAVIVPLDGQIRVAGTAEFSGYDTRLDAARIDNLKKLFRQVLPNAPVDLGAARPWCGLRAMSADGVPIIGGTSIENLYVNGGHGHLGWTMAAGSAEMLTDLMMGRKGRIDSAPYAPERFGV